MSGSSGVTEERGRFGLSRPIFAGDINGAWLVVVIRPDEDRPEATARFVDTYKVEASGLPEDPAALMPKLVADLRGLADDLERRGWLEAFRDR